MTTFFYWSKLPNVFAPGFVRLCFSLNLCLINEAIDSLSGKGGQWNPAHEEACSNNSGIAHAARDEQYI